MTAAHVAIVGGGITGLAAAYYLQEAAREQAPALRYTLLEGSERWGGKIRTEAIPGEGGEPFVVEAGPDSFITQKPWAWQLARRLGLEEELLPTNDASRQIYVLNKGKPTPLPEGVLLIVPTKFMPFALSPLISPLGKLRMGLDLVLPAKRDGADETLAEFITRRLGAEALDKIAEPLMSGIYNAEADRQSLLATFPRFRAIEEKHGSLIRGMLAARQARSAPAANGQAPAQPPSVFVSFRDGMETLVSALRRQLDGDLRLNTIVQQLGRGAAGGYRLALSDGSQLDADAVILAVPAYVAASLLRPLAPAAAAEMEKIRYVSTGTISLAYRASEIGDVPPGHGLVVPASEARHVNAVTISSSKFDRRAPAGMVLVRAFFGGSRTPQMMDVPDAELLTLVRAELRQTMGMRGAPLFHRVYRWPRANPQYDVGHLERVAAIEAALPPSLFVSGSPYRGIGIPDCVHQAEQTVNEVLAALTAERQPR
jgi:protoporphyrinogen/coproporphyrinogen III oxidase